MVKKELASRSADPPLGLAVDVHGVAPLLVCPDPPAMEALHNTLMGLDQDVIIRDVISFSAAVTRHLEPHVGPEYAIIIAVAICIYAPLFVLGYAFFALIGQKGFRRCATALRALSGRVCSRPERVLCCWQVCPRRST